VYEDDHQARAEASDYALSQEQLAQLRPLVDGKRAALGAEGVRGHPVQYNPAGWDGLIPGILAERSTVSRGNVFDLAESGASVEFSPQASFGEPGIGDTVHTDIVRS
jgi:hypothetical protein